MQKCWRRNRRDGGNTLKPVRPDAWSLTPAAEFDLSDGFDPDAGTI
jgi:hypothetical protein